MDNLKNLCHMFMVVFVSNFSSLIAAPALPDITINALCPGESQCSTAVYFTGFQQTVTGIGSAIIVPLTGKLSDVYGRKTMLIVVMILSIFPWAVLAFNTTTYFFYAYYAIQILTGMVTQGGVACLSLAYLADTVSESTRISAFGYLSAVIYLALSAGTLVARLLPTTLIFKVAASVSILGSIYVKVFLEDIKPGTDALKQPICESSKQDKLASYWDILLLLKNNKILSITACISFLDSLSDVAIMGNLMYYFKARFGYSKDQFADVSLITFVIAILSNVVLVPMLGPRIGEETLLSIALFAAFLNMFFDSIAWATWVPYAAALLGIVSSMSSATLKSIISKQAGPNEQGLAQGCIVSMMSIATVVSPLIFSPLTALFLSEDTAPFPYQGFSMLCIGLSWLVGFFLSIAIHILSRSQLRREVQVLV